MLDRMFKHLYGDIYDIFKSAHKKAVWVETNDPGPFLVRVIVWKLQCDEHLDNMDKMPTATFTADDTHVGGYMQLLDLETQFLYGAGSVAIGWTGFLWHKIHNWQLRPPPDPCAMAARGLTPGRVGIVNYFPTSSFEQLTDKDPSWAIRTMYGNISDVPEQAKALSSKLVSTRKRS